MVCHTASVTGGLLILICVCQCAKYASMDYSSRPKSYAAGSPRKINVIEYGEPCECCKVLPYYVEVPQTPTDPILQEYQYSVDIPPTPVKDERRFSYDYKVLVPKEDPIEIGCSYDYRIEIPPEPEKETKYSFSYELQVPKPDPQPQPKTYTYSYQITQPEAPKPADPLKLYSYQLEVPQPQTETRLTGLLAEVDTIVVPRRCSCRRCGTDENAAYSTVSAPIEGACSDEDTNNYITEYANFGSDSSIYASVGSRYSPAQYPTRYKSRRTRRATDYRDNFGSISAGKFSILTYNEDRAENNARSKDDIDTDSEFYNDNEFVKTHRNNEPRVAEVEDEVERSSPMPHVYDKHSQTYPELSSTSKYFKNSNCGCKSKVEISEEIKETSNRPFQKDLLQSTSVPSVIKRDKDALYISSEEDMRVFGDRPWFYYNRQAFNDKDVNVLEKRSNWKENRDDEVNEDFPRYERNFKESINKYKIEKLPAFAQTHARDIPVNSNAESDTEVVITGSRSKTRRSKNRKNASKSDTSDNIKVNGMNANSKEVKNSHPEGMSAETSNLHHHHQRGVTTIHKRSDAYDDDDEYTSRIVRKQKVKRRNDENNEVLKSETNRSMDARTLEKSDNALKRKEDMGYMSFEGKETISRSHTQRSNSSKKKTVQRDTKIIRGRGTEDDEYHNNENVRNDNNAFSEEVNEEQKLRTSKHKSQAKNYTNNSEWKTNINSRDFIQDQRAKRDNNNQQFVITRFPSQVNYPHRRKDQYDTYKPIHDYDKFGKTQEIGTYMDSERKHNSFNARPSSLDGTNSPIYQQLLPITKKNGYYTKYGYINKHTGRKSDDKISYAVGKQCFCKPIYNKFEKDFWNEASNLKNIYNAKKLGSENSEVEYDSRKYSENIQPLSYSVPKTGYLVNYVGRPYDIKINQPDHHRCYKAIPKERENSDSSYSTLSFRGYKDLPKHKLYESGLKYKSQDVKDEDYMQVASDNKNEFYLNYRNRFIPEGYSHSYPHSQYGSVDEIKSENNIKVCENVKNDLSRSVSYVPNYVQYQKPKFQRTNYNHNFETIPLVRNANIYIKSAVPTFSSNQFQSQSEQETLDINNAKEIAQEAEAQEYGIVQEQSTKATNFAANLEAANANNFKQNTAEEIEGIYSFTSSNVENQIQENATNESTTNSNSSNINHEYVSTGSFQNNLALELNDSLQLEVENVLTVPPIELNDFLNQAQELQAVELLTDALQSEIEKSMSKIAEIQESNNDVTEKGRRKDIDYEGDEEAKYQSQIESKHNSDKNFDNIMFLKTKATERKGNQYPRHKDKHIKDVWENYNVYDSVLSGKNFMWSQDCRRDQTTKGETLSTAKYEQILPSLPHLINYRASSAQKYPAKRNHLKVTKNPAHKKCKNHKLVVKNHDLASENVVQLSKKCGNILHDNEIIEHIQKTCDSGYEGDTYEIIKSLVEPNYYTKQELKAPSTTYFLPEEYELKHYTNIDIVSSYPDKKYTYDEIMTLIGCDEFKKYTCNDILKLIGCDACQYDTNELYRKEQDQNDVPALWYRSQPQNSISSVIPKSYYLDKPNKIVKEDTASNFMMKEEIKKLLREINAIQSIVKTWYLKSVGNEAKKNFLDEIKVSEVTQEEIQDIQLVIEDLYSKYLQYRDIINYDIENVIGEIETACQIQHEIDSIKSIIKEWYHMNYLRNRIIDEDIENIINEDIKTTEVLVGDLEDDLRNIRHEVREWSHSQTTTKDDEYKGIGDKIVTTSSAQENFRYEQPIIDYTSSSILDKDAPNNEFKSIKSIIWRLNRDLEKIQPILKYICQMHKTSQTVTNEVGGEQITVVAGNESLIAEINGGNVINVTTEDTMKSQVESDKNNTIEDWEYKHRTYSAEIGEDDTEKSENRAVGTTQIVLIPLPNSIKKDYPTQKLFWESSPAINFHELISENKRQKLTPHLETYNYYKHDNGYDKYNDSPYFTLKFIKKSEKENNYPNSEVQRNNEYHNNINKCSNSKSPLQKYDIHNKKNLKTGTYPTSKFIREPQGTEINRKHLTHSEISDYKQKQYISVPSRPEIQFVPYKHVEYKQSIPMRMKEVREKYTPYENLLYYPPPSHERLRRSTEFHIPKSKEYQEIKNGEHETQIKAPMELTE